ncbi:MAG: GFA family protein [Devosia sp.]
MDLPDFPVEGGCQCGVVRYRLLASPLSVYNCHCKDCQRFSGAAWSISMPVESDRLEHLSGTLASYDKIADSGRGISMQFCVHCHGWLWNRPQASPALVMLRAGSLDSLNWAVPVGNIWTDSKVAWVDIDPALVNMPGQPASREPLYDAWTELTGKDRP